MEEKTNRTLKSEFRKTVRPYQDKIDSIMKDTQILESDRSPYKRLQAAEFYANMASYQLIIHEMAILLLGSTSQSELDEARQTIEKAVAILEKIYTTKIDASFADYKDKIAYVEEFSYEKLLQLITKIGLAINLVSIRYKEGSRWYWYCMDITSRLYVTAKNSINQKTLYTDLDPRNPNYKSTTLFVTRVIKYLNEAASVTREKYELFSNDLGDLQRAINYLGALKRIYLVLNRKKDAENLQKVINAWTSKYQNDFKVVAERVKTIRKDDDKEPNSQQL